MWTFQSHAGSIEADVEGRHQPKRGGFQSHAGSIEASASLAQAIEDYKFQSHAGSIEASPYRLDALLNVDVSIPRWFD